ncbi:PilX N-terminal domain-containing pilus assembly protein [Stutzerimonas frequens]|jgi:type IV pilus assembly protein PilX|uniref:PilX N-terminal domain-containing pilus assembly protein n=1 Tax=Stutzerimonas frequens TaxID=2968969 RepID=UPI002553D179|nr:PilX N-terminal domain-containing pilus assembly protein [Stutzerimonas frequens]MDL0441246.1 PilX N-terminal domain-containing pilus assembly protein [Stutzerimonas frequens]WCR45316.1 PilX N-terminal domain-containing pilus assembly protein [Stutzerimonas stutzeri]
MMLISRRSQGGAVLLVSLVMLLVLTVLAVSSMRGVTLESRITANREHDMKSQNIADAALREAEFRFYGPGNLSEKLEAKAANCLAANTLKANGINSPCLLEIKTDRLLAFVEQPQQADGDDLLTTSNVWMPYRGTDPTADTEANAHFNSILADVAGNAAVNAEYGGRGEGSGTYFYLNNGKAGDALYLQSTHANIYLGLNN